ncbi:MAG: DUF1668 domain-containing protein [Myxococcaceae bacterium]|nr:DUF1668 domain-containing protein [Myxococcaceae bacterium]
MRARASLLVAAVLGAGCFAPVVEGPRDGGSGGGTGGSGGSAGGGTGGSSAGGGFAPGGAGGGAIAGAWVARAPLKFARAEFATAVHDGLIYVFGGTTGSTVGTVEVYDPAVNQWALAKSMPTPRRMAIAATLGPRIYVVGGFKADENLNQLTYTNVTEAYEPATNTWTTLAPPPFPVAFNTVLGNQFEAGAVLGGKLRVLLFDTQGNKAFDFDPAMNTWTEVQPPAPMIDSVQVAVSAGTLYAIGGGRRMGTGGDFTRLASGPPDFWTNLTPLRPASSGGSLVRRECVALVGTANAVAALGGSVHDYNQGMPTVVSAVDVFDPASLTWKSGPPLAHARQSLGAVAIGNTIYAIGGTTAPDATEIVPVPWVEAFTLP